MESLKRELKNFGVHFLSNFFATSMSPENHTRDGVAIVIEEENKWDNVGMSAIFGWLATCLSHPGGDSWIYKVGITLTLLLGCYFFQFKKHKKTFKLKRGELGNEAGVSILHILYDAFVHSQIGEAWLNAMKSAVILHVLVLIWEYSGKKNNLKYWFLGLCFFFMVCYNASFSNLFMLNVE